MRYNKLGPTGLFVSELCLGTMTFGASGAFAAMGAVDQPGADALLGSALEAGVNIVDTADTYSNGAAETILGRSLRNLGVARENVVVATKVFGEMGAGPNARGTSRGHILSAVRASLRRLQTDYIDLYQLHGFDPATPIEESLAALDDLVRRGDVRYVGVSNWAAWQIAKALGVSALRGLGSIASLQAYYSLVGRGIERDIVPLIESEGIGLLVWSPLAGGLLGGKTSRGVPTAEDTRRAALAFPPVDLERAYDVIDVLRQLSDERGVSVPRLAIAWLLHRPHVTSVIVGAKRLEQLDDNLAAVDVALSPDDMRRLDEASRLASEYPGWMLDIWSGSRVAQVAASHT